MKQFDKWFFPAGEEHLPGWMQTVNNRQDGRLTYQYGKYEAAMKFIKGNAHAVDVGSHIGLWAYFMARDFQKVTCFEPMPKHAECWRKNMQDRENATLIECALGSDVCSVKIGTRTKGSSGDTGVLTDGRDGYTVPQQTLDYFELQDVNLLKIDCEGYEEFVLRGGIETLKRCKPVVIVEQKGTMSEQYGLGMKSAVTLLISLGAKVQDEISGDFILSWD